jgi:hypothetical protein
MVPYVVPLAMSKHEKLLQKMRNNPRDWAIDDLIVIANRYGFKFRQPGTSHATFSNGKQRLTVPSHKPIKPVYVLQFIAMIEEALEVQSETIY